MLLVVAAAYFALLYVSGQQTHFSCGFWLKGGGKADWRVARAEGTAEQATKTLAVNANKAKVKALQPQVRIPIHTYTQTGTHTGTHIGTHTCTHTGRHTGTHADKHAGRQVKNLQIDGQELANNNNEKRERESYKEQDSEMERETERNRDRVSVKKRGQTRQMKTNQWATAIGNSMAVAFHDCVCECAYVCVCVSVSA